MHEWAPLGPSFFDDEDGTKFEMVSELLRNFVSFYDRLSYHGMWFPADIARETSDALVAVGCYHQALCNSFKDRGRPLFYMTEKAHYAQHIAADILTTRFNPAYGWTYRDEDYMGRVAATCKACAKARGPLGLANAFIFRFRNHMHLRWRRMCLGH